MTEETRKKLSIASSRPRPWQKNRMTEEVKQKLSLSHKGKKTYEMTEEIRNKISLAKTGKPGHKHTEEDRKKMSEIAKKRVLDGRHNCFKGGITSINKTIRKSVEYKLWRESVFKRDNWTCIWCGIRGLELNADHIKPFALFPELRFAIDNGRTLCVECHRKTDTWGR